MKKNRNFLKTLSLLIFILCCTPVFLYAQGGDPGCDPLCNCRADQSICPIDNGVWVLLIIGVLYGIKKIRDARKKELPAA
jgi:hypothetical protein